jgi:hypothetical protein
MFSKTLCAIKENIYIILRVSIVQIYFQILDYNVISFLNQISLKFIFLNLITAKKLEAYMARFGHKKNVYMTLVG